MQNSSHLIKAFDVTYTADSSTEVICPVCPVRSLTDKSHHVHLTTVKVTMLCCEPLLQVRWESPCLRPFTKYLSGSKGPASVGFWSPICLHQPLGERSYHPPPVTNPCRKRSLPGRRRSHQQNRRADFLATNSWATVFEMTSIWPNKACLNTIDCMNQVITVRWEGARKTSNLLWTFIPKAKENCLNGWRLFCVFPVFMETGYPKKMAQSGLYICRHLPCIRGASLFFQAEQKQALVFGHFP